MLYKRPKLVALVGPTASGKSVLAIKLAKKFNGEIISADSRQIYEGMDIGTAKSYRTKNEKRKMKNNILIIEGIPHYMIDVVKPDKEFTLTHFKKETLKIIKDIQKRGKIPFLVGGTGLYVRAVTDNLEIPKVPPDKKLRKKLEKEIEQGTKKSYHKLLKLDPAAKKFIDPQNPRRIIRALEVCLKSEKSFSQLRKKGEEFFDVLEIGIKLPKEKLHKKINQRVDKMIKQGLIKETKELSQKYSWDLPSMSGIGYKQIGMHLRGEMDLKEAIELIKRDTRRYAKRQITWFKRDKRIKWITNYKEAKK